MYVPLDSIDFRGLIYYSDKAQADRKERQQNTKAGRQAGTKPRFKLKGR